MVGVPGSTAHKAVPSTDVQPMAAPARNCMQDRLREQSEHLAASEEGRSCALDEAREAKVGWHCEWCKGGFGLARVWPEAGAR